MMPSALIVIGPKVITPTDATKPCKTLPNYASKSICVSPKKKRKPFKWHSNSKYNNWNVPTRNEKRPFVTWAKEVMPSNGTLNPIDTVYGYNTIYNMKRLIQIIITNLIDVMILLYVT